MPKSRVRKKNGKNVKHQPQSKKGLSSKQMRMITNFLEKMKSQRNSDPLEPENTGDKSLEINKEEN